MRKNRFKDSIKMPIYRDFSNISTLAEIAQARHQLQRSIRMQERKLQMDVTLIRKSWTVLSVAKNLFGTFFRSSAGMTSAFLAGYQLLKKKKQHE